MNDVMFTAMAAVEAAERARNTQWQFRETLRLATGFVLDPKVECCGWIASATVRLDDAQWGLYAVDPNGVVLQQVSYAQELPGGWWGLYTPRSGKDPARFTLVQTRPEGVERVPWQYLPTKEDAAPCSTT
jgi:hypothetical protein